MITQNQCEEAIQIVKSYFDQLKLVDTSIDINNENDDVELNDLILLENYFSLNAIKAIKNYYFDCHGIQKSTFTIHDIKKIDLSMLSRYRGFGLVSRSKFIELLNILK